MNAYFKALVVAVVWAFSATTHAASTDWWVDITNDRVEQVRSQLAMGEDPNVVSSTGQPSIMQAIQDGAWDVYELFIRHRNIDVNITNSNDETPLMYLAVIGETKRASELIKKGAQVNRLGWTPLHYAASKGHLDTVKLLLANQAMVNAPSPDGTSPLMMAAFAGSEPVVRELLAAGADPTARNRQGEDAADWGRRRNHNGLAAQLDDLTARVLKNRAAGANATTSGSGGTASNGSRQVYTLDPVKPSASSDKSQDRSGLADTSKTESGGSSTDNSGSTSRYFDLERFERDDDRF